MGGRRKAPKRVEARIDGLNAKDMKQLRTAMRRVWSWSYPRRLAKNRSLNTEGFHQCEKCNEVVPKIQIDHKVPCGKITDPGFIERLYCPSTELQALCPKCHRKKTKDDKAKGLE